MTLQSSRVATLAGRLAVLLVVFGLSRALVRGLPGDPMDTLMAETGLALSPAETSLLRHELGLDRPFLQAWAQDSLRWLKGDWGRSLLTHDPVGPRVRSRFVHTALLAVSALAVCLILSIPLGLAAARSPGGRGDQLCDFWAALTASLPTPWFGPAMIYLFAIAIPLAPTQGGLFLPALTLGMLLSGGWSILIRERVRESMRIGSAQAARARGVPEVRVLLKYGLAPASGALLAYLGTQSGALLGGALVTEAVFGWEGLGTGMIQAVLSRDYPMIEASLFIASSAILCGTWIGDGAQSRIASRMGSTDVTGGSTK